jgi:hypothetical protein
MKKYTIEKYLNSSTKRWDIINYLIEQNKYINYLEIGVNDADCIRRIKAPYKDGVDPFPGSEVGGGYYPEINYPISSDDFFKLIQDHKEIKYDIIFIDGLHHSDQVDKDISNSLNHLTKNGTIVLHDCNPPEYETQLVPRVTGYWNGDVWKSVAKIRYSNPNVQLNVIDTDWGVGILQFGSQNLYDKENLDTILDYNYFDQNREEILNLISIEEFYTKYKKNII